MKFLNINIRVIATSAITIPLAMLFPSNAVADEPQAIDKSVIQSSVDTSVKAPAIPKKIERPTLNFTLPLLSQSVPKEITAPANITLDFSRVEVKAVENPEIEKERLRVIAEKKAAEEKKIADEKAAAEKKIADAKAAKEKAEAEKKAAEEKKIADEKKAEESRIAAEKAVQRDDDGFGAGNEYKHFMPSKEIEAMTDIDDKLVSIAATGVGNPYVWGGTTPAGWDCSGYVQWIYKQAGIDIPRVNQWTAGKVTTTPVPGDIVVQNGGSHVGIYIGGGMMYSALNPDEGTKMHPVNIMPSYFVHIDR